MMKSCWQGMKGLSAKVAYEMDWHRSRPGPPGAAWILFILLMAAGSSTGDTIIDNTDAASARTGTWQASDAMGFYGTGSVWGRDGATFTWNFTAPQSGQFDVAMWWTVWPSRSNSIPVDIEHSGGTARAYVDQSVNGGLWNELGRFTFVAGQVYKVTITSQDDPTSTCADAVKFAYVTPAGAGIIDNTDAATSRTGTWQASDAAGFYGTGSLWARDGATFTWIFTPARSGAYELSMWWTAWSSRSDNVPVDIQYAGGTARAYVNQLQNGGQWNSLGSYAFAAGTPYRITVTAQPDPTSTCADAVRLSFTGSANLPPVAQIVSITPNPAMPGNTIVLQGKGTDSDGSITAYSWRSSIDGVIGGSASVSISTLSAGTHTIYFKVRDDKGAWSQEVSANLNIGAEDIYIAMAYNDDDPRPQFISMFRNMGAVQQGDIWVYTNSAGKTFRMHWVESISALRQALKTTGAHIIIEAHSNYGLGPVFATPTEIRTATVRGVYYIDDPRVFRASSPWIAIDVKDFILEQAYPDWWPEFADGTSGIMPYTFGSSRGDPPYNYYETYQVPGDPTWYKIESGNHSALQRFPDSGKPAWYAADGSTPNPANLSHQKYFITNPASWSGHYPKPHYLAKTIIRRKDPELQPSELKYSRLMYNSCGSGYYYAPFFNRGIMFYTLHTQASGDNSVIYLRNYMQGKSDYAIWRILQNIEPVYDYYDFTKLPPALQSQAVAAMAEPVSVETAPAQMDSAAVAKIDELAGLSTSDIFERLKDTDFFGDDELVSKAIQTHLTAGKADAIAKAIGLIELPPAQIVNGRAVAWRARDAYVAKMVLKTFAVDSTDQLVSLYRSGDDTVRGNVVCVAGDLADVNSIRSMLFEALDDTAVCEPNTPETIGRPLRLCDVAYNQLVLHYDIRNVLRTIGTPLAIEDRDYHINILKQKLNAVR